MAIGQFAQSDLEANLDNFTKPDNCHYSPIRDVVENISPDIQYVCPECDFVTKKMKTLNVHLMRHSQFFKCEICKNVKFGIRRFYIRHMKEQHKIQGRHGVKFELYLSV